MTAPTWQAPKSLWARFRRQDLSPPGHPGCPVATVLVSMGFQWGVAPNHPFQSDFPFHKIHPAIGSFGVASWLWVSTMKWWNFVRLASKSSPLKWPIFGVPKHLPGKKVGMTQGLCRGEPRISPRIRPTSWLNSTIQLCERFGPIYEIEDWEILRNPLQDAPDLELWLVFNSIEPLLGTSSLIFGLDPSFSRTLAGPKLMLMASSLKSPIPVSWQSWTSQANGLWVICF